MHIIDLDDIFRAQGMGILFLSLSIHQKNIFT